MGFVGHLGGPTAVRGSATIWGRSRGLRIDLRFSRLGWLLGFDRHNGGFGRRSALVSDVASRSRTNLRKSQRNFSDAMAAPCRAPLASGRPPLWIREFPSSLRFMRPEFGGREIRSLTLIMPPPHVEGKECFGVPMVRCERSRAVAEGIRGAVGRGPGHTGAVGERGAAASRGFQEAGSGVPE